MTERLTPEDLDRLADAVCRMDASAVADERSVTRAAYGLLAAGQPVTAEALAAAARTQPDHAAAFLDRQPAVERDLHGDVVGFGGLSLRPTQHRLVVHGQVRYAWCAWDTLFLPVVLGAAAAVTSRCAETGRPVRLRVAPAGILERDPADVAVSFIHPTTVDVADLRGSFCRLVRFLADPAAADRWAAAAGRLILDLDDAFDLGRRLVDARCGPC